MKAIVLELKFADCSVADIERTLNEMLAEVERYNRVVSLSLLSTSVAWLVIFGCVRLPDTPQAGEVVGM